MARPATAADEAYAALAAGFVASVMADAEAHLAARPPTAPEDQGDGGADGTSHEDGMSRPPTGLLQEESALAVEAALGVALRHLQQHGLLSDGKPLDWDMAFSLLAGIIETWPISNQWKYHLEKRGEDGAALLVGATFSIPTRRRPVPNATASVQFRLMQNADGQIDIAYTLESQRLQHSGTNVCRDKWLRDILANKRLLQEQFPLI